MYYPRLLLLYGLLVQTLVLTGQSEQLVREVFDYAALNPMFCLGDTTDGFLGPWTREIGDDAIILRGSLGETGAATDLGNRATLEFIRAGIRYNRPITRIQDDGNDLWVAVDMDFRPGSAANNVANLTLTRAGSQAIAIGRKFGNRKIGLVFHNATNYNTDVDAEGLRRLVLRIRFSGDTDNEEAWLWVDPDEFDANGEPTDASADLTITRTSSPALRLNIGIDGVQLKNEGTPPLLVDYDNLILARTYAALSPDYLISTTSPRAVTTLPLTVYPNPATGPLTVTWDMPERETLLLELLDLQGKVIWRQAPTSFSSGRQSVRIPTTNLPDGTYLVRSSSASYRGAARVVVSRRP
ncbi:T9SS type A sorting domain-containing protein [Lewinella sp. W8]|uniref:T9SS type A sorting domain-containing protein n=1 Tax=Lewinella sp. W8 TaxID=2528208 RepID=UPI001067598B|nr:T9SS type A sorting domain-containing protein [Lewinella sp. W8]MTB50357.1 T9SS type A sorting domain-containing protein [Lewinella sp. W8]